MKSNMGKKAMEELCGSGPESAVVAVPGVLPESAADVFDKHGRMPTDNEEWGGIILETTLAGERRHFLSKMMKGLNEEIVREQDIAQDAEIAPARTLMQFPVSCVMPSAPQLHTPDVSSPPSLPAQPVMPPDVGSASWCVQRISSASPRYVKMRAALLSKAQELGLQLSEDEILRMLTQIAHDFGSGSESAVVAVPGVLPQSAADVFARLRVAQSVRPHQEEAQEASWCVEMQAEGLRLQFRTLGAPEELPWFPSVAMAAPEVHQCCNIRCGVVLSAPILRCSKCQGVCYCSRACQKQAWKAGHKRECSKAATARRLQGELETFRKMRELYFAKNWRGLEALEATATAAAKHCARASSNFATEIYWMLGTGCCGLEQYAKAITLYQEGLVIAMMAGDRKTEGSTLGALGGCYTALREYAKAIDLYKMSLTLAEETGCLQSQCVARSNLFLCYEKLGQHDNAFKVYEQCLEIAEESSDRSYKANTFINLADCCESLKQYDTAIGLLEKARVIIQEFGERADVLRTVEVLGRCKTALGKYEQAITCHTEQWAIAQELDLAHAQTNAALNLGVVVWAQARVKHGNAAGASTTPSASGHPAAYMESMRASAQWLRTALQFAQTHRSGRCERDSASALLHLAFLAFDTGEKEEALDRLKQYLQAEVDSARSYCRGCMLQRGDDVPMLTCSGCSVARFCNEDHQGRASRKGRQGQPVRHKDMCSLLRKWRQVKKGNATAESCTPDLLAFLRQDLWWRSHVPIVTDFRAGACD